VSQEAIGGVLVAPQTRTAERYAELFLAGYKPRTAATYTEGLRQWFRFHAEHGLDPMQARRSTFDLWRQHLELLGRAPATIANRMGAVTMFVDARGGDP
jgi:hypothetical protein